MNTKNIALAATLLLASAGAQAATTTVMGPWGSGSASAGYNTAVFPTRLDTDASSAQHLITSDMLADIAVQYTSTTATKAAIKSISFQTAIIGCYALNDDGVINIEVTAENTSATDFPKESNNYLFLPFGGEGSVKATLTIDADYDDDNLFIVEGWSNDGISTITLTFDEPLVYNGESLLLTWRSTSTLVDLYDMGGWWDGSYSKPTNASTPRTLFNENYNPTGKSQYTSKELPVLLLEYDTVEESIGGGEGGDVTYVEGDPATFQVGYKNSLPSTSGNSYTYGDSPVPLDYSTASSQTIYTTEELNGICNIDGTEKAKITDITAFFVIDESNYFAEGFDLTVYVQNYDGTTFPLNSNNQPQWIEYSTEHKGSATVDDSNDDFAYAIYSANEIVPVTIHLDDPIIYEGKSLLITWQVNSYEIEFHTQSFTFSTSENRSAIQPNTFSMSGTIPTSTDKATIEKTLPCIDLGYIPMTAQGGTKLNIVSFENVTLGFGKTADGSYNYIKADFDLVDDANCGPYTIKVGTIEIGTITEKQGTITYIDPSMKQDMFIAVVPAGENSVGQPYTIAAADVAALFTAPAYTISSQTLGGSYDITNHTRITLDGAFLVEVSESPAAPIVNFSTGTEIGAPKLMNQEQYSQSPLAILIPENTTRDNANDMSKFNVFAICKSNLMDAIVKYGSITANSKGFSFAPQYRYPIVYASVPTLGTATQTTSTNIVVSGTSKYVSFDPQVCDLAITINENKATEEEIVVEEVKHQGVEKVIFYYPTGQSMYCCIFKPNPAISTPEEDVPAQVAMFRANKFENPDNLQYVKVNTPALVVLKEDLKDQAIHVYTEDGDGNLALQTYQTLDDDGNISGIADVVAGQSGEVEFYNLQGVKVDTSNLTPGIYVARRGTTATKVVVR